MTRQHTQHDCTLQAVWLGTGPCELSCWAWGTASRRVVEERLDFKVEKALVLWRDCNPSSVDVEAGGAQSYLARQASQTLS